MSVDRPNVADPVRQARTDQAFEVKEPLQNSSIAPRVIPIVITLLVGLALIAILFILPNLGG